MRCILDTHAFLWFIEDDSRLSSNASSLILEPANKRFLSVASLWEMAIKTGLGRLALSLSFPDLVEQHVRGNGMELLPILPAHLEAFAKLPFHHKDPFDRLIIAQAMSEDLPVITRDAAFSSYDITVLWNNKS